MQTALPLSATSRREQDVAVYLAGAAAILTVVSIAAFEILMGLALVALLVSKQRLRFPPLLVPFGLFVLGTLASVAASGHARAGLPQVKKLYLYLLLALIVSTVRNMVQVRAIALGWALAASLSSAWGLEQFVRKYRAAEQAHKDFYLSYIADRITGFMGHWMTFSGHMMMALLIITAIVFFSSDRHGTAWLIAGGAVIGAGLIVAETRSMWLGAAVGGVYLVCFYRRWVVLAVPAALALLLLANPFELRNRALSIYRPHGEVDSNAHRAVTRRVGWEMVKAHPWLGLGPEQIGPQFEQYIPADVPRPLPDGYYGHLHNIYLQFAAERGVPTMLALMWMLGQALLDFARALRRLERSRRAGDEGRDDAGGGARWMLHAAIAVTISILVAGFFEYNLGDSEVLAMFLAVLGCGYVAVGSVKPDSRAV